MNMVEREYSRVIQIQLVATVRASSSKDADRLIDEIALGKLVGDTIDGGGSLMENWLPKDLRGAHFSYHGSLQGPIAACTHDEMGLWQTWHSALWRVTMERFSRKEFMRLKKEEQRTLKAGPRHRNGLNHPPS
jgi:hypothetical protein